MRSGNVIALGKTEEKRPRPKHQRRARIPYGHRHLQLGSCVSGLRGRLTDFQFRLLHSAPLPGAGQPILCVFLVPDVQRRCRPLYDSQQASAGEPLQSPPQRQQHDSNKPAAFGACLQLRPAGYGGGPMSAQHTTPPLPHESPAGPCRQLGPAPMHMPTTPSTQRVSSARATKSMSALLVVAPRVSHLPSG